MDYRYYGTFQKYFVDSVPSPSLQKASKPSHLEKTWLNRAKLLCILRNNTDITEYYWYYGILLILRNITDITEYYWYYGILQISRNITDITEYYRYYGILQTLRNITNITEYYRYYGILQILRNITDITEHTIMEYYGMLQSIIYPPPCQMYRWAAWGFYSQGELWASSEPTGCGTNGRPTALVAIPRPGHRRPTARPPFFSGMCHHGRQALMTG